MEWDFQELKDNDKGYNTNVKGIPEGNEREKR